MYILKNSKYVIVNVIAAVNLLTPFVLWWLTKAIPLSVQASGMGTAILEFACSLTTAILIFRSDHWCKKWAKYLSISLISLACADLVYGVLSCIIRIPPPRGLTPLFHEIPYALFSLSSAIAVFYRAMSDFSPKAFRWMLLALFVLGGIFFAASYKMILLPFYAATPVRPMPLYATATLYALGQSIFFGGLIITSIRASTLGEFNFWSSYVLLIGTDFALRYQDMGNPIPQLSFFEYGWHFSIAASASIIMSSRVSSKKRGLVFGPVSSLNSIRVITAAVTLVSLITFLVTTWTLHSYLSVATAGNVGSQLVVLTFTWAFANTVSLFVSKLLTQRSLQLSEQITRITRLDDLSTLAAGPPELYPVVESLHTLNQTLQHSLDENVRLKSIAAAGEIASQVAHDIRSPLAALMVAGSSCNLPEDSRIMIRAAIGRICDIANNLLTMNKSVQDQRLKFKDSIETCSDESQTVELISPLIDSLTSEKRLQYRANSEVQIEAQLESSYGLFALIHPSQLKRILSNLIDNAIEALRGDGRVTTTLSLENDKIVIRILDNGRGIPASLIPKLGQRGVTFGKEGGSGLGIYHATKLISEWGGSLEIASEADKGTEVLIQLPRAQTPAWFVSQLSVSKNMAIVVLDDDKSIHQVWDRRFDSLVRSNDVRLIHLSTPAQMKSWVHENPTTPKLFLVDYELLSFGENGLDLIETLGVGKDSILVSSRFEESKVRERCDRLAVKVLPKGMAGIIPIAFKPPIKSPDVVLIDDDTLVHMTWKNSARAAGKVLDIFQTCKEFDEVLDTYDTRTPVFIDSRLGDEIKGEEYALKLHDRGFNTIFLATGYEASSFPTVPWIKGVVGKEPPFQWS